MGSYQHREAGVGLVAFPDAEVMWYECVSTGQTLPLQATATRRRPGAPVRVGMATSLPHGFHSKLCFQQPGARLAGLPAGESGDLDSVPRGDRHQVCARRNPLPLHGAKYGLQTRLLTVPGSLLGMQGQKHHPGYT